MKESIQTVFLNQVKRNLAANVSFVDELAEALGISRDSAYRRIRGDTILSLDEAKTLYHRFGVSIDLLFSNSSEMVTFHRRVVSYSEYNLEKWLGSIIKNLDHLRKFEKKELIFSAKDIPVFHYFRNPQLCAFKMFFWMKTLLGYPQFERTRYSMDAVPRELLAMANRTWEKYASLPTSEIWNQQVLYDTISQIEYYHQCELFENPEDAQVLCDQIEALLNEIERDAAKGAKSEGGEFQLYNNEILIADNTVYARMGDTRCVYVNQNALNLLLTFQEPFCEKTEMYLKNLIQKSVSISVAGQKQRTRFFRSIRNQVQEMKNRLQTTVV